MAIKLDLNTQRANDKAPASIPEETPALQPDPPKEKSSSSRTQKKKTSSRKGKRGPAKGEGGRPKEAPMVARSIRIRQDIYDRLVEEHEKSRVPYNELMNRALDEYLK